MNRAISIVLIAFLSPWMAGCGIFDSVIGPAGPQGPAGADGQLRIYGNGSAGDLNVTANGILGLDYAVDGNLQFNNVTIAAGVQLAVPSGMVFRCTGSFTNEGTITVSPAAQGALVQFGAAFMNVPLVGSRPAESGVAKSAAGIGTVTTNGDYGAGGAGGLGLFPFEARMVLNPGIKAGGGGGSAALPVGFSSSSGGGSFVVLARGAIVNAASGLIKAVGDNGIQWVGGGGGGVIVLASAQSVTQNGTLNARGGDGAIQNEVIAAGGGGGGGIVHLLAPVVDAGTGVAMVEGGAGGAKFTIMPSTRYFGGGGGGACGGNGGAGGSISSGPTTSEGGKGGNGYFFTSAVDPTALF